MHFYSEAAIFDLRHVQNNNQTAQPIVTFPQSNTRLNGAHFSPLTGNYVSTLSEDTLSIYDVEGCTKAKCKFTVALNYNS